MKKIFFILSLFFLTIAANAQQGTCAHPFGPTDEDSLRCTGEITLFRTFFMQKSYNEAYRAWRAVVTEFPCSWDGVYNNKNVQDMFKYLIDNETDSLRKETLIDSLMWVFESRHQFFPKKYSEGEGKGWVAYSMLLYRKKEVLKAHDLFIESIESQKEKTQPVILNLYFSTAIGITKAKKDTNIVIDAYERITTYLDVAIDEYNIKLDKYVPIFLNLDSAKVTGSIDEGEYNKKLGKYMKDTATLNKYILNYKNTLNNIELKFTPYAPCHVLEQVYAKKLETNRENLPVLAKIIHTMQKSNCIGSPIFTEALSIVHSASPNANSAFLMGKLVLQKQDFDKAIEYFREAITLFETNEKKADAYYCLASTLMLKQNYSEARTAALEAIKLRSNYGNAYILIGDLYAYSGGRCSGDNDLPLAYNWAASDKYSKAAAVDPKVADAAREKRSKLSFPSNEEKFKRGLKAGDTYRVGCWIQENTTVR